MAANSLFSDSDNLFGGDDFSIAGNTAAVPATTTATAGATNANTTGALTNNDLGFGDLNLDIGPVTTTTTTVPATTVVTSTSPTSLNTNNIVTQTPAPTGPVTTTVPAAVAAIPTSNPVPQVSNGPTPIDSAVGAVRSSLGLGGSSNGAGNDQNQLLGNVASPGLSNGSPGTMKQPIVQSTSSIVGAVGTAVQSLSNNTGNMESISLLKPILEEILASSKRQEELLQKLVDNGLSMNANGGSGNRMSGNSSIQQGIIGGPIGGGGLPNQMNQNQIPNNPNPNNLLVHQQQAQALAQQQRGTLIAPPGARMDPNPAASYMQPGRVPIGQQPIQVQHPHAQHPQQVSIDELRRRKQEEDRLRLEREKQQAEILRQQKHAEEERRRAEIEARQAEERRRQEIEAKHQAELQAKTAHLMAGLHGGDSGNALSGSGGAKSSLFGDIDENIIGGGGPVVGANSGVCGGPITKKGLFDD